MRPSEHSREAGAADRGSAGAGGVVVGAPASGAGKTTVTLALVAAARRRGLVVQPFKVGPDFIDPGHLSRAADRPARCLDGWMLGRAACVESFEAATGDADVAFVEGMMGLFDGLSGSEETASTAEIAKWLALPVVLVVDAGAMARSVAALVQGFRDFDPALEIAGVVFNRIGGAGHLAFLQEALAAIDVACLGGLPLDETWVIPERHLGLRTAVEAEPPLARLAAAAERHLDLDRIFALARRRQSGSAARGQAPPATASPTAARPDVRSPASRFSDRALEARVPASCSADRPVIAVARDEAFSFYYPENLEALERAGAALVEFSPLRDRSLPHGVNGIYLGGGYPELHAATLAANTELLAALRGFARRGGLVYAECGGLMLLGTALADAAGTLHRMASVFPFTTRMLARGLTLGYREVTTTGDGPLAALTARGHEFHHSTLDPDTVPATLATIYRVDDPRGGPSRREGFTVERTIASYVHLHFSSAPSLAPSLVALARQAADAVREGEGEALRIEEVGR